MPQSLILGDGKQGADTRSPLNGFAFKPSRVENFILFVSGNELIARKRSSW